MPDTQITLTPQERKLLIIACHICIKHEEGVILRCDYGDYDVGHDTAPATKKKVEDSRACIKAMEALQKKINLGS